MTPSVPNLAFGFVLSTAIAALAYRKRSLSGSGAAGAIVDGAVIFGLGGWAWGLLLIAFFVSSSTLSHVKAAAKEHLAEKFAKTSRRDVTQVLANGGLGALLAVLCLATADRLPLFVAFAGAMAAVNADTWATELGVLSPRLPRLITSGKVTAVGTSGAISLYGTAAAAGGALFIGALAAILAWLSGALPALEAARLAPIGLAAGLGGALADSVLGATVQGIYWCERDQKETEKRVHGCGERTRLVRGWGWLDNEWVNFACSLVGASLAWLLWQLWTRGA